MPSLRRTSRIQKSRHTSPSPRLSSRVKTASRRLRESLGGDKHRGLPPKQTPGRPKGQSRHAKVVPKSQPRRKRDRKSVDAQREYPARAILAENSAKYLVAWCDDPQTGEKYDATWEPKENVGSGIVAMWKRDQFGAENRDENSVQVAADASLDGEKLNAKVGHDTGSEDLIAKQGLGEDGIEGETEVIKVGEQIAELKESDKSPHEPGNLEVEVGGVLPSPAISNPNLPASEISPKGVDERSAENEERDGKDNRKEDDEQWAVRAILAEDRRRYLIDWEPDARTGEVYEPTWELKTNVGSDIVDAWRATKKSRKAKTKGGGQQ